MSKKSLIQREFKSPMINLDGKSVLVTGGTGSFGKHFVKTVLSTQKLKRLIIYSRDELKQFEMMQDLSPSIYPCLQYMIGDVRDASRVATAMRNVDYVVHAAALKQVPTAEYNPFECIHTNVLGAENIVNAAIRAGVKKVIAFSTDKAANPANLYGASKLASDKIFVAANHLSGGKTKFSVVRYGNVLGSRGSVVPFFRKILAEGATVLPITDPKMTRFWVTLSQSVNFVCSSLEIMHGGEIFVTKLPSMRLVELANWIAPGVPFETVGIRPGEKNHELMITVDDGRTTLEMDDRYIIQPTFKEWVVDAANYEGAKPVAEDFSYASDTNTEWLDEEFFLNSLGDL
jgi:UDP-N-acetylglucosamine 4,6-dehydratase/5-epimerase